MATRADASQRLQFDVEIRRGARGAGIVGAESVLGSRCMLRGARMVAVIANGGTRDWLSTAGVAELVPGAACRRAMLATNHGGARVPRGMVSRSDHCGLAGAVCARSCDVRAPGRRLASSSPSAASRVCPAPCAGVRPDRPRVPGPRAHFVTQYVFSAGPGPDDGVPPAVGCSGLVHGGRRTAHASRDRPARPDHQFGVIRVWGPAKR